MRFCKQTLFVWIVTNGLWGNWPHKPRFLCLRKTEEVDITSQFLVSTNLSVMELHVTHSMLIDTDQNLIEKQWAWHFFQRFGPQRIWGTEQHPQYYICEAKPLPLWVLWRLLCKHKRMLLFWVLETSMFTSHSVLKKKSLLLKNLLFPPGSKHLPSVHRGTRKSTWKCSNFTVIRKGVILHLR